jgi:hypothetical protein
MGIGARMWTLWRLRTGVAISLVLAVLAAVWSVERPSLSPPGLSPRQLHMATASTHILVDTPRSTLLDLRQDTYAIDGLRNRTILLGNVMASIPLRTQIAERAGIPAGALQVEAPRSPDLPEAASPSSARRGVKDITRANDQYRLTIQANPTVPMLDVYTQSPDARSARALANGAVAELRRYVDELARTQGTPPDQRLRLLQLGPADGGVINGGIEWKVALLAFVLMFGAAAATTLFVARVRQGWRLAALDDAATSRG